MHFLLFGSFHILSFYQFWSFYIVFRQSNVKMLTFWHLICAYFSCYFFMATKRLPLTESSSSKAYVWCDYFFVLCHCQVWLVLKPCLALLYFQATQNSEIFKTETIWSTEQSMACLLFGTISVPCLDHVRTMFGPTSLPDQPEL